MTALARSVHVKDPKRPGRTILLTPGEEPALELAVQIRNPAAWEGGKLPAAVRRHLAAQQRATGSAEQQDSPEGNGDGDTPPPPPSTGSGDTPDDAPEQADGDAPPAKKPAPRRTGAAKGTGGQ